MGGVLCDAVWCGVEIDLSITLPSKLTLLSMLYLQLIMSDLIVCSDSWGPKKVGPSNGSLPFNRANSTTPRDQTSRGGPGGNRTR